MGSDTVLEQLGYEVRYRERGWVECLLSREGESWLGHGPDRAGALEHALRRAFPSHGARELLRRASVEQVREPLTPGVGVEGGAREAGSGPAPSAADAAPAPAAPAVPGIGAVVVPAPPAAPSGPPGEARGREEGAEAGKRAAPLCL